MKKLLFASVLATGLAAFAAEQTLTGVITDSMCGTNHAMMQHGAKKLNDHDCTVACVKSGQKYILVGGDKTYEIANQDFAGVQKYAGSTVKATGHVSADGKSITVAKLSPVSGK